MLVKKGSMLILSLVLFLLFTNGVSASSSEFPDVSKHWASEEINKWVGQDLIKGYSDGTFRPDSSITRAEFIVLVNKIFNYKDKASLNFNDVGKQDWFSDDMAKAVAAGLVKGDSKGNIYPDTPITRQEVSVILYQAFKLKVQDHGAINKFSDADQIASWSRDAVNALLENGFIQGRSEKIFAPQANITRGEAVKMIDRVTGTLKNIGGTYSGDIPGNLVVNTQDVVLKDMKISCRTCQKEFVFN